MRDINFEKFASEFQFLESQASIFIQAWIDIDTYIEPELYLWYGSYQTQGMQRNQNVYDNTGAECLNQAVALVSSLLTPSTEIWHRLESKNAVTEENTNVVNRFLFELNQYLFKLRYDPFNKFDTTSIEVYWSLLKYGTGVMFIEDHDGVPFYNSVHISEIQFVPDRYSGFCRVYRKFRMNKYQADERWPGRGYPDREAGTGNLIQFLHVVLRDHDDLKKPFKSYYYDYETQGLLEESFYHENPYIIVRYKVNTGEIFGRSPAYQVLPSLRLVNQIKSDYLKSMQLQANPPFLAPESLEGIELFQNKILVGGLAENGQQLIRPLEIPPAIQLNEFLLESEREIIRKAFLTPLFSEIANNKEMTATETMERKKENMQLIAPYMSRLQTEMLNPLIVRELGIIERSKQFKKNFPNVPAQLKDYVNISYSAPYNQMRSTELSVNILQFLSSLGQIAQFKPDVLNYLDYQNIVNYLVDGEAVPTDVMLTDEMIAQNKQQQEQQQQMSNLAQVAPQLTQSAKDLYNMQQARTLGAVQQ